MTQWGHIMKRKYDEEGYKYYRVTARGVTSPLYCYSNSRERVYISLIGCEGYIYH